MNKKPVIITSLVALAAVGTIGFFKYKSIQAEIALHENMVMSASTVSAAAAVEQSWPNSIVAVGSLASFQGITVKTELDGLVSEVLAVSGSLVAKGDLLVRLDTASEEAQLAGLEAQAKLADLTLVRARELRASGTNTAADFDAAEAGAAQAHAAVESLKVTISKKQIRAPFAGRLGITKVYAGQVLSKGDSLVELECVDPIHADFSLPQQELARVKLGQKVQLQLDVYPGRVFEAEVTAISPRVTDATRMIDLRASLPNKDEALRAGMYARVEVSLPATPHAMVLPASAVVHNPYGETVYVIEQGIARQRFIKTGAMRGDLIQVLSGLKVGDQVVTSGQLKLRNGSPVKVDNSAAPEANPAPKPVES